MASSRSSVASVLHGQDAAIGHQDEVPVERAEEYRVQEFTPDTEPARLGGHLARVQSQVFGSDGEGDLARGGRAVRDSQAQGLAR